MLQVEQPLDDSLDIGTSTAEEMVSERTASRQARISRFDPSDPVTLDEVAQDAVQASHRPEHARHHLQRLAVSGPAIQKLSIGRL
jgi:hypothetical protein